MNIANPSSATNNRPVLIEQAFRLEYITLTWMTMEAAVAVGAGIVAGSLTLTAFGIDNLIELASACVLVWRLNVELRHGQAFAENAERTASRIGGALLFALAGYVVARAFGEKVEPTTGFPRGRESDSRSPLGKGGQ
jgi:hypothetical protein